LVRDRDVDNEYLALVKAHPRVWSGPNMPVPITHGTVDWLAETLPAGQIDVMRAGIRQREAKGNPPDELFELHCRNLRKIHGVGKVIGLGTDGTGDGIGVHDQMAAYTQCGMTAMEAIVAGTGTNARILRLDRLGSGGEIVNFTVNVINRSVLGAQIGCNTLDVTANFFCPGPTGQPNGTSTNLFTNLDIPANDALAVFGPFPCVMPDIDPEDATAQVVSTGTLDDGNLSPFLIRKEIVVQIQTCLVQVDKQISCDGGVTWVDAGLVFANEDGTNGCTTTDGTPILVRYQVRNAGLAPLHACVLTETNTAFGAPGSVPTPIAPGATLAFIPAPQAPVCSDSLEDNEPNTASVNCFCQADLNPDDKVSASDSADLTCQSSSQL
jgi:hypothetical protein